MNWPLAFLRMYHWSFFYFSGATAAAAAAAAAAAGTEGFGVPDEMDDHDMGRLQGNLLFKRRQKQKCCLMRLQAGLAQPKKQDWKGFHFSRNDKCYCFMQSHYRKVVRAVGDFYENIWYLGWFWAVWQYWKKIWADYEQLLRAFFSCFLGQKTSWFLKNIVVSELKTDSCKMTLVLWLLDGNIWQLLKPENCPRNYPWNVELALNWRQQTKQNTRSSKTKPHILIYFSSYARGQRFPTPFGWSSGTQNASPHIE